MNIQSPSNHNVASEEALLAGKHFLVIEDDEVNILVLSLFLKKLHATFDVAKDGETGLQLFEQNNYDIVITDIHVPGLTGDEVTRAIRLLTDKVKATKPVIALTANNDIYDIQSYLDSGITDVLMKPFKVPELKEILYKHLLL